MPLLPLNAGSVANASRLIVGVTPIVGADDADALNNDDGILGSGVGDSGNAVHYTVQTPTAPEQEQARENVGLGEEDTATFGLLEILSADAAIADNIFSGTIVDEDASGLWRAQMIGINLGFAEGGASFLRPDVTRTGWGLALESNYFSPSHGTLQHEYYFTSNASERIFSGGLAASVPVDVASIVANGSGSIVTIVAHSEITNYLIEGLRFFFTSLNVDAANVAVGTVYRVGTILPGNLSFNLENEAGTPVTTASASDGEMDRGGWGNTVFSVPLLVNIGTATYSNYKSADITEIQAIASFSNSVTGHDANVEIRQYIAGVASALSLRDTYSTWNFSTLGSFASADFFIYSGGSAAIRIKNSDGNVGIGFGVSAAPAAKLDVLATTEQLRLGYDASNYYSTTVSSAGAVTFNAVGAGAAFTFSDAVTVSGLFTATTYAGDGTGLTGVGLTANTLAQFAATTSLELKNTISDETGSGALVFGTAPTVGGDALINIVSTVTTGSFGSGPLSVITTGNTLTTGILLDLASAATSKTTGTHGLRVAMSGALSNASQTTTAASVSNTHTGTTETNVALTLTASGATTNTALNITAGSTIVPSIDVNTTGAVTGQIRILGAANNTGLRLQGSSTSGQSFGALILAGTTLADYGLQIKNAAGSTTLFTIDGTGAITGTTSGAVNTITLGDSATHSSVVLASNLSGATDPTITFGNALVTFSSPISVTGAVGTTALNSSGEVNVLSNTSALSLGAGQDVRMTRGGGAGVLQHGTADAATAVAQTIRVQSIVAGTADVAGQNWTLIGSKSTGSAASGNIIVQVGGKGAASTTQNTVQTGLTVTAATTNNTDVGRPSVIVGNSALATTATDGFLYIPGGAGAPAGTPTAVTGRVPLYWDSTAKQLYIYDGAWLQPKTPAGAAIVTWQ